MTIDVEIKVAESIRPGDNMPGHALLEQCAKSAYLSSIPAVVSMLLTDEEEMRKLNKQYRNKNKSTNVLSFPMQLPVESDVLLLGDIALCVPVINREAKQQSKTEASHWAHMIVHGMLHLQGYDHVDPGEAEEMENMEISILEQLGFENPYKNYFTDQ